MCKSGKINGSNKNCTQTLPLLKALKVIKQSNRKYAASITASGSVTVHRAKAPNISNAITNANGTKWNRERHCGQVLAVKPIQ